MSNLKILRLLALTEGISYLLLAITMYLKYSLEIPKPNMIVGMIHGILFIGYCIWSLIVAKEKRWPLMTTFWVLFASLIPFGTFIADAKILNKN